jgi:TM2 domain-containing membrane protein YozV
MASKVQVPAKKQSSSPGFTYSALILGWLIPGAGHLLTGRWVRGLLLFVSIAAMFWLGIAMQGKLYVPNTGDVLEMLGFVGDFGNGLFYAIGRILDLGRTPVQLATADYGTKFIVVAGLLNFISAVDAHNLRIGRKA